MSINGLRVLNTRPTEQGLSLHQAICDAGGVSIDLPALAIEPTTNNWLKNLPNLESIHQVIFISTNAVNYFYSTLEQQGLAWPATIQTTAIGKASAAALEKWRIRRDHVPSIADSEHLLQLNILQHVKNQTILLVKGEGGKMDISNTLLTRGAHLISLAVYRRTLPNTKQKRVHSLWHDDQVDIILFTSQQAMHNIFTLFGDAARYWLCGKPCLVISERLAEAAFTLGMRTILVSRYDTILKTLEHYNQERACNNVLFWRPNQGLTHGNPQ